MDLYHHWSTFGYSNIVFLRSHVPARTHARTHAQHTHTHTQSLNEKAYIRKEESPSPRFLSLFVK